VVSKYSETTRQGYKLEVVGRKLQWTVGRTAAVASQASPLNTFVLATGVFDGQAAILYVNGVEVGRAQSSGPLQSPAATLRFGGDPDIGGYFTGTIDELCIYRRPLAPQEVLNIYQSGAAGICRSVEFEGIGRLPTGGIRLLLRGLPGLSVRIDGSTDMVSWTPVISALNQTGVFWYDDNPTVPSRFYRVTIP